jgi:hypothetical protein
MKALIVSLIAAPAIFALATLAGGSAESDRVTLALFAATVLIEVIALTQVLSARKLFSPADPGYLTWTLVAAFLIARLLGELRLATINFQLVPRYTEGAHPWLFAYVIVLRYLYTLSDVLFIVALITTIRAYKSTGLKFELVKRDYVYMSLVWVMPVVAFVFRSNLIHSNTTVSDKYIASFRLITITVGAFIASLCLVVRRYVSQMGGGAVARVWNMAVIAGVARVASFLALALMSGWWRSGAGFMEQYLLWIFACCWLLAAIYQRKVLPQAAEARLVAATAG